MKIIAVDTSHNTSLQKTKAFLRFHNDADIIYTFDFRFNEYGSLKDLRHDFSLNPHEFFSRPCAYYDMVTAIIEKAMDYSPDSIYVFSPGEDECSRLSDEDWFENYILHFEQYHPDILVMSSSLTEKPDFSIRNLFTHSTDTEDFYGKEEEDGSFFDADESISPFSLTDTIKKLFRSQS